MIADEVDGENLTIRGQDFAKANSREGTSAQNATSEAYAPGPKA